MIGNYHIMTDASADMEKDFVSREDIKIIPMNYMLGDEERVSYATNSAEEMEEFYNGQRDGLVTKTSQINPQSYVEEFTKIAEKGEDILYLSLSGGLSSTYQSSIMAASEVMDLYPDVKIVCVDSRAATVGLAILVELAAKNRQSGMTIEENAKWLEENRLRIQHWFMVEDLMFLKRGGRISAATAMVGVALNIKPILKIEADGSLLNFEKKRGSHATINRIVDHYRETSTCEKGEHVFVTHADNVSAADYLEGEIKKFNPDAVVSKIYLTPIIGCHVGPGMCAIAHFGKPECARK